MHYHRPSTFEEAARIAADTSGVTRFLLGGTDVLVQLRSGMVSPDDLIDLKGIPGVDKVARLEDGGWHIGVAVPGVQLAANAELIADWPGVVEGLELVGSTQIQGRATLIGNLCNASPAADGVPCMVTAGASVTVVGPNGTRSMLVEDIPVGPGKTSLGPGEVISGINLPPRGENGGDAYLRFIPRTEMDIAVVGCALNLRLDGDRVTEARVALGAVAPKVVVVPEAAEAMIGSTLDGDTLGRLASAASAACSPINDKRGTIEYRTQVAGVLARRVARIAYSRAKG